MASKSSFQKLEQEAFKAGVAPRTKQSLNWFKKRLKSFNVSRPALLKDEELLRVDKPLPGRMYMYFYDPKYKETLPYYDRFPLIILVDKVEGGFTGLNLHYLPPNLRAKFFDKLLGFTNNKHAQVSPYDIEKFLLLLLKRFKPMETGENAIELSEV